MNFCFLSIVAIASQFGVSGTCKWTDKMRVEIGHYQIKSEKSFNVCAVIPPVTRVNAFVKWSKNIVVIQTKIDCNLQNKQLCPSVDSNFRLECVLKK